MMTLLLYKGSDNDITYYNQYYWVYGLFPLSNAGCNRIKYTSLKIYRDQTNSNITTVSYRTFINTSIFLQVFNMAVPGYAADIQTIF
jgi:hypothetical protein